MKKLSILALAFSVLAVSCNKGPAAPEVPGEIRVKASIGELTKVSYDGEKSAFAAKDTISVYAWMDSATEVPAKKVVDGVVNTFDGQVWNPRVQMLWKTVVDPHYFLGIAPARYVKDFKADAFEQNPLDYAASDLLIATNLKGVKASDGVVSLAFDHAMAKLNVNLTFRDQWTALPKENPEAPDTEALVASVSATGKTTATVNYLSKAVTATGDASAIAMNKLANANWTTLMVPQTGFRTVTIVLSGNDEWLGGNGTFVYNAPADITLESGKITTLNLILGRDQIVLADNGITITDWATGVSLPDGEAVIPEED